MKNTKDNIIQEQTDKDLERELGIQMSLFMMKKRGEVLTLKVC